MKEISLISAGGTSGSYQFAWTRTKMLPILTNFLSFSWLYRRTMKLSEDRRGRYCRFLSTLLYKPGLAFRHPPNLDRYFYHRKPHPNRLRSYGKFRTG